MTGLDLTILIPQNEPVDIAFDDAGVLGHGEAVEDGLLVAFDAVGEGVQVGLVVGVDGGEPVAEAVAVRAGEDLGELGDVAGARVQVRAVLPGPGEFLLSSSSRLSGAVRIQLARSRALAARGRRRWLPGRTGRSC
jgi:hypothetical protein